MYYMASGVAAPTSLVDDVDALRTRLNISANVPIVEVISIASDVLDLAPDVAAETLIQREVQSSVPRCRYSEQAERGAPARSPLVEFWRGGP